MSNNVQTAEQWAQVAAEQDAAAKAANVKEIDLLNQLRPLANKVESLETVISRFQQVINRGNAAIARGETLSPAAQTQFDLASAQLSTKQNELATAQSQLAPLREAQGQFATQRVEATRAANDARAQQARAASGPPNDNTTVQPAGASTNANSDGNNTAVAANSDDGTGGFRGTTIADNEATTTTVSNGIVTKTQDFPNTAVSENDASAANNDEDGQTVRNDNINPATDPGVRGQDLSDEEILARRQASGLSDEEILTRQGKLNTAIIDPPKDWRVRISLARSSNYLYNAAIPGILAPLKGTNGVVFPYTPSVSVGYSAQYDSQTITHSNFKMHNYTGSSVDQVSITGDFTAQDVAEANYMLAVIHFFRSATKMFYGKDQTPAKGTPPPLLYLSGFGNFQFDNHPMVLTNFTYALPVDVDYINAYPNGAGNAINTVSLAPYNKPNTAKPSLLASGIQRLLGTGLQPGGASKPPVFVNPPSASNEITRVPTKISIALTFLPIVTRNAITNGFSLKEYANGNLLRGSKNPQNGGGIW